MESTPMDERPRGLPMSFEDLLSWQEERQLTRGVYMITRKDQIAGDFGLSDQIQRAAVSTMSNVAEGFGRRHIQGKLQFYNVAHGSNAEVRSLTYVKEGNYRGLSAGAVRLRQQALQCGGLIAGLIHSTESKESRISS